MSHRVTDPSKPRGSGNLNHHEKWSVIEEKLKQYKELISSIQGGASVKKNATQARFERTSSRRMPSTTRLPDCKPRSQSCGLKQSRILQKEDASKKKKPPIDILCVSGTACLTRRTSTGFLGNVSMVSSGSGDSSRSMRDVECGSDEPLTPIVVNRRRPPVTIESETDLSPLRVPGIVGPGEVESRQPEKVQE